MANESNGMIVPLPSCRPWLDKLAVSALDRRPVVISGPSGVGKSTLCRKLQDAHPGMFAMTVSHTTRSPRPGEIEGASYHFVSRDEFQSLVDQDAFIEYTEFNDNLYGTSKQTVIDQTSRGSIVLLDIEMEGVKQLKKTNYDNLRIDARLVFIQPPSLEVLEQQLRGRGTEGEVSIGRRLAQAKEEMEYAATGAHHKVIVNDDLEDAAQQLEMFVLFSWMDVVNQLQTQL